MSLEQPQRPESVEKEAKIVLHFMRHGEKEGGVEDADTSARLTSKGRDQSREIAIKRGSVDKSGLPVGKQSLAFGSSRVRSRETAGWAMAGNDYGLLEGDETFYELLATIDAEVEPVKTKRVGSKIRTDERLNFKMDRSTVLGNMEEDEYVKKSLLKFIVENSDRIAKELGDRETSTYSSMAGAIASVVKKYVDVSGRWHELVNDDTKEYQEKMERFLGTHQTVPESFLAKVIEKTKGIAERDRFVLALNGQGFDFVEGFDVEVVQRESSKEPVIKIRYSKNKKGGKQVFVFDEEIPSSIIDEIIEEGKR